jgi:HK97 family phage major capsid protein
MKAIGDHAERQGRDLTAEEGQHWDRLEADLDAKSGELRMLEGEVRGGSRSALVASGPEGIGYGLDPLAPEARARAQRGTHEYVRNFVTYLRTARDGVDREIRAALQVNTDAEGGYLVPDDFVRVLIEAETEFSAIRRLATVITTENNGTVYIPAVDNPGAAAKIEEEGSYAGTDPTLAQRRLDSYKYGQIIKVSDELVMDSAFDIVTLIARLAGKALGTVTGAAYTVGDGTDDPNGLVTASSVGVTMATGNPTTIDVDALTDLQHSVVSAYRDRPGAGFLMKDSTLAFVRKIKTGLSGDKTTLWQPSVQAGVPDSLLGKPVYTDPNMAALGTSSKVVLFGDYSEYWIRDVGAPTVKVLNERYADTGQIGVRVSQRTDGELADTSAVKALSTSAT